MNATTATVLFIVLNAVCAVALDRAPSRGYQIGAPDSDRLYPPIEPPTNWRKYWRPVSLYLTIASAIAAGVVPLLTH